MGKQQRNTGKNQGRTQNTGGGNRQNKRQANQRKGSQSQRQRPAQKKAADTIVAKSIKEVKPQQPVAANTENVSTVSIKPPAYERSLQIKIPPNLKKKNASIDIPDLQSLRKEKGDRVLEALKALEETLDQFQYPEGNLPAANIKDLVMEIEAFEK